MKKILMFLLIMLMLVSAGGTAVYAEGSSDTPGVIVVPENSFKPLLGIVSGTEIPVLKAGSKVTLKLPVKNNSPHNAKDVVISLSAAEGSSFPFIIDKLNTSKKIDKIESFATYEVEFELELDPYVTPGQYILQIGYSYSNFYQNTFESSEIIAVNVVNENKAPKVVASKVSLSKDPVLPGESVIMSLTLKNLGTIDAKDIKVTLMGLRGDGFMVDSFADIKYLEKLEGSKEATVVYKLKSSPDISDGNYPMDIKIEYKDIKNTEFMETTQFFIPVGEGVIGNAKLKMDNIEYPSETLKPGSSFKIGLDLVNSGNSSANNIKVTLVNDSVIINKSLNIIMIDALEAGKSQRVEFELSVLSDAATKNYPIGISVEYDNGSGDKAVRNSLMQYVGVYVEKPEEAEEKKTVPKIIVDKYSFEPSEIKAGEDFKLTISFFNTNSYEPVSNIKVTFSSDDGTFNPVNSSSTFFIDNIAPKGKSSYEIILNARPDAAPKTYTLSVNMEYEDSKGNQYTARDVIGIIVQQLPKLVAGELELYPEVYMGQPIPLYLEFFNMGKSTLYNLMVTAEGDFQVQGSGYFVGNFEPGRSDSFDVTVIPTTLGAVTGNIVFSFEDASGKPVEVKKEFTMNVMEMPVFDGPIDMYPGGEMPPAEGKPNIVKIALIAGGAVLGIIVLLIVILLVRKKIRARKELTFDEEL